MYVCNRVIVQGSQGNKRREPTNGVEPIYISANLPVLYIHIYSILNSSHLAVDFGTKSFRKILWQTNETKISKSKTKKWLCYEKNKKKEN